MKEMILGGTVLREVSNSMKNLWSEGNYLVSLSLFFLVCKVGLMPRATQDIPMTLWKVSTQIGPWKSSEQCIHFFPRSLCCLQEHHIPVTGSELKNGIGSGQPCACLLNFMEFSLVPSNFLILISLSVKWKLLTKAIFSLWLWQHVQ